MSPNVNILLLDDDLADNPFFFYPLSGLLLSSHRTMVHHNELCQVMFALKSRQLSYIFTLGHTLSLVNQFISFVEIKSWPGNSINNNDWSACKHTK